MASRQIVSYDDLYSGEEAESAAQPEQLEQQMRPDSASSHTSAEDDKGDLCAGDIIAQPGAWDDSELVRAWDSTVEDYRKHHASILGDSASRATMHESESKAGEWSAVIEDTSNKKRRHDFDTDLHDVGIGYEASEPAQDYASALSAYPEAPLTEEDALNKLNMAWYHAGYYAGYYQAYRMGVVGSKSATDEANVGANAEAEADVAMEQDQDM
ncbi:hypothetical protein GGI21_002560 [Coemansia aciculifera]|nr:hypothetical protein GGI21_002560 [Coemansia aciculifera]